MRSKNKYHKLAKLARQQRQKQRMCSDKVRFETEAEAFQKGQRSYQCPHCHGWHRSGKLAELVAICRRKQS